jgi:hypothetical protein
MSAPTDNESWIVERGDAVIQRKAARGFNSLTPLERLIYCLWVADYGMRNAGDLVTASDIHASFQTEGALLAKQLGLNLATTAFVLPTAILQNRYFDLFDGICDEIRALEN